MIINTSIIKDKLNIDKTYDFDKYIKDRNDIIEIKPCHIKGTLKYETNDVLVGNFQVNCDMILASSRSLKPVDHKLEFELDLIFGDNKDADFSLDTKINLSEIIYGHILSEKPLTIYLEDELEETIETKRKVNPAFEKLVDWQK